MLALTPLIRRVCLNLKVKILSLLIKGLCAKHLINQCIQYLSFCGHSLFLHFQYRFLIFTWPFLCLFDLLTLRQSLIALSFLGGFGLFDCLSLGFLLSHPLQLTFRLTCRVALFNLLFTRFLRDNLDWRYNLSDRTAQYSLSLRNVARRLHLAHQIVWSVIEDLFELLDAPEG